MGALGVSGRTVRRRAMAGEFKTKLEQNRRGGKGGSVYLVELLSLPPEAQRHYLERALEEGREDTGCQTPADEACRKVSLHPANGKITRTAELVAKYGQEKAYKIISTARRKWEKTLTEALLIANAGITEKDRTKRLEAIAKKRKIGLSTLYRKMEEFQKGGVLGLVGERYRAGEGLDGKERRSVMPEVRNFILSLALKYPAPKSSHIYRELGKAALLKGWAVPSRATVYRVIEEILHTEKIMGRKGDKEYEAACMPKVKRDYSHLLAMEEIVGDGHIFDLFVEWEGRAVRPQLSCWEDMRSRKIVGWCVTVQANSETIGLALRHAIQTHGLPATIYTDNGKDYLSSYIEDVCQRLGIDIRNCIPKTPRSKMIERLFRTVHDQFTLYQLGYCGNKPGNRPPDFDEKKLLKQGKLSKMEEFVERWAAYVEQYNNQVHSEIRNTPTNAFATAPHVRPGRVKSADLDILMMKREKVKVHPGYITLLGREYWSHDIELGRLVGEWVQVWYDFNRMGEVLVWYKGKFIGTATNRKALEHGDSRADLAAELKAARKVRKAVKEKIASYAEGLEGVLPHDITRRAKRNYASQAGEEPGDGKVQRLTGHERATKEAREVLERSRDDENAGGDLDEPQKTSRAERLLRKAGARVLAREA